MKIVIVMLLMTLVAALVAPLVCLVYDHFRKEEAPPARIEAASVV